MSPDYIITVNYKCIHYMCIHTHTHTTRPYFTVHNYVTEFAVLRAMIQSSVAGPLSLVLWWLLFLQYIQNVHYCFQQSTGKYTRLPANSRKKSELHWVVFKPTVSSLHGQHLNHQGSSQPGTERQCNCYTEKLYLRRPQRGKTEPAKTLQFEL